MRIYKQAGGKADESIDRSFNRDSGRVERKLSDGSAIGIDGTAAGNEEKRRKERMKKS